MISFSLSTSRLYIRPLLAPDAAFILELVNTEGWLRFIGNRNVTSLTDASAYIEKILGNANITYWVVTVKEDLQPAGIVTFIKRDYLEHPDIGFAFLPEFSKKGYALEATEAALEELINTHNVVPILATTIPDNINSIRLLGKLKFVFEKEIQPDKEILHVYHRV